MDACPCPIAPAWASTLSRTRSRDIPVPATCRSREARPPALMRPARSTSRFTSRVGSAAARHFRPNLAATVERGISRVLTGGAGNERCRSESRNRDRRESVHTAERARRRSEQDGRELLAHRLFARRTGARALSQERADGRPLAYLLRQHRDGALAAID